MQLQLDWQLMFQNHKRAKKISSSSSKITRIAKLLPSCTWNRSWTFTCNSFVIITRVLAQPAVTANVSMFLQVELKIPKNVIYVLAPKVFLRTRKITKRDCFQNSLPKVNFFSLRMLDSLCLFVQQLLHLQMFPCSWSKVLHAKYNRVLFSRRIKHPLLATVTNPPL